MRCVAREQHAPVPERGHALALERVDRRPGDLEGRLFAEHGFQARDDALGLPLLDVISLRPELEVDAPHVVRLLVQENRLAFVEGWLEMEPALGREIRLHLDVDDEEAVVEDLSLEAEAEHVAKRRARAIGGNQPIGFDGISAIGRLDADFDVVPASIEPHDLVAPPQIDERQLSHPLDQISLEVILLQVDEGRALVAGLRQEVEAVHERVVEEHLADLPADALPHHALADANRIAHLESAL